MMKIIVGMLVLASINAFATDQLSEHDLKVAAAKAELSTNLWFCAKGNNVVSSCEDSIVKAKAELDSAQIEKILKDHLLKRALIMKFEKNVKAPHNDRALVSAVKELKAYGVGFKLVKSHSDLNDMELLRVQFAYDHAKSDIERQLDRL